MRMHRGGLNLFEGLRVFRASTSHVACSLVLNSHLMSCDLYTTFSSYLRLNFDPNPPPLPQHVAYIPSIHGKATAKPFARVR